MFSKESRRRAEDILEEVKATYHVQVFSGAIHGFGTRGDPEVEDSRMYFKPLNSYIIIDSYLILGWAKEKSAQGITEWFIRFSW